MELFAKKIEKQLASYQQELIETHYREVDNMYRQIRGWRHDYRNHIQTMKAYAAAGDWDAIRNYLDLLDTDLQLRSSTKAPAMALIERALIRLAMMPRGSR